MKNNKCIWIISLSFGDEDYHANAVVKTNTNPEYYIRDLDSYYRFLNSIDDENVLDSIPITDEMEESRTMRFEFKKIYTPDITPGFLGSLHPWNSVFQKSECESIACNIMVILGRTGNTWRELTWSEYQLERYKDNAKVDTVNREKNIFDAVLEYTVSPEKAAEFSKSWEINEG